jgi:abequosyltransferase
LNANIRLSICIATLNRAGWIGQTLDALVSQVTDEVEIVVVDGASTDGTGERVLQYAARYPQIVYRREQSNSGVDRDFDKAVAYARGEYCWLMSDDDVVVPHAISAVLRALADGPALLIVNSEIRTRDLSVVLKPRQLDIEQDTVYAPAEIESFFAAAGGYLSFIGAVVIRREVWLARAREPYYGSLFIHVGVIFQPPSIGRVKALADPLVRIRYGNALWTARGYEIWTSMWPRLVWSFDHFSAEARRRVSLEQPARRLTSLLWYRAIGALAKPALDQADRRTAHPLAPAVAALPARLLNSLLAVYCAASSHGDARMKLYDLSSAGCAGRLTQWLARRSLSPETGR